MKTIKFLTTLIPDNLYTQVKNKSHYNMSDAANALQWHIHEGLCKNYQQDVEILNILPVGSFPQYYEDAFVKTGTFASENGNKNVNIGFCNIKLLRKYDITKKIYKMLMKAFEQSDEGTLYLYTISSEFIEAVSKFKERKPGIQVCAIIADLPNMSSLTSKKNIVKRLFERHLSNKSYKYVSCVDAFVLLTKQMADYMHIDKPFCVVEGISTMTEDFGGKEENFSSDCKTILYSGTLHRRFGVMNLLVAFEQIKEKNYKLVICGTGDCEEDIRKYADRDKRIEFRGQLVRKEILKLQKSATVLVNPRQNNEEFTKYSFPSKIMEYLSSGIPVVAYRLDGVPDEYEQYIFYVKGDSIENLADKLREVCEMSPEDRRAIGKKGREFVLNKKNSTVQTAKIVKMMEDI